MQSSWVRAAAVTGVAGLIALFVPLSASIAQPETAPGPAQPVTVEGPLPLPVQVTGQQEAGYVVLDASRSTSCDVGTSGDECPGFVAVSVSIPEGKDLIVETVSIFWEAGGDFVPATATVQHTLPPFQRHAIGDTFPVEGLTGADSGATASLSFLATSGITGVVGFPDERPEADFVGIDMFIFGRLIDEPAGE